jgi:hypothetical protein
MLFEPETGAAVELHTSALHRRSEHIIPALQFHRNTRSVIFRGACVRLPDATRTVGHNIVHDALDHDGHLQRRVELRQLLDLVMIRTRHEKAIDWAELDRCFSNAGVGHVLATNLKSAEGLFGMPVPDIVRSSQRRGRRNRIARISRDYLAARRHDPWGVLNLFKPKTWPGRIHKIRMLLWHVSEQSFWRPTFGSRDKP